MRNFCCFVFLTLFFFCYSQEQLINKSFTLGEGNPEISFIHNSIHFDDSEWDYHYSFSASYSPNNGSSFILINNIAFDNNFNLKPGSINDKWIVFNYKSSLLLIYNNDNSNPLCFFGPSLFIGSGHHYTASSFLTENGTTYSPVNVSDAKLNKVWATRTKNHGINEWINIDAKNSDGYTISKGYKLVITELFILNGYISYNKPFLFERNNRVKMISVMENNNKEDFILTDTTNIQRIILQSPSEEIKIIIKDIYKGSYFDDTCISKIFTVVNIVPE